jgi:hypothetical protein
VNLAVCCAVFVYKHELKTLQKYTIKRKEDKNRKKDKRAAQMKVSYLLYYMFLICYDLSQSASEPPLGAAHRLMPSRYITYHLQQHMETTAATSFYDIQKSDIYGHNTSC